METRTISKSCDFSKEEARDKAIALMRRALADKPVIFFDNLLAIFREELCRSEDINEQDIIDIVIHDPSEKPEMMFINIENKLFVATTDFETLLAKYGKFL